MEIWSPSYYIAVQNTTFNIRCRVLTVTCAWSTLTRLERARERLILGQPPLARLLRRGRRALPAGSRDALA